MSDAPNPTPDPAAQPPASTAAAPWFDSFQDPAVKAFATAKNWATSEEAVRSTLNLEKLVGVPQDQVLKLPKADAPDADWAPVYDRLGRPKTADEYNISVPPGADESYAKHVKQLMHESGLTAKQAEKVAKGTAEYVQNQIKAQGDALTAETVKQKAALEAEWGAAAGKNVQIVRSTAAKLGLDTDAIDSLEHVMGLKGAMQFIHKLGVAIGEDKFEGGSFGSNVMSPAQAQAKIELIKTDGAFVQRYATGDAAAKQEMDNLHLMAYPPTREPGM